MNIHELDSYDLGDAVKFNDRLNPKIWDDNERMRPEVREQLLRIADDFREFLGINVEVKDITVSGSNAAYTYTPHSDIDLHLVVDLPRADENAVYRELFDAKKYAYNDMHDIKIGGSDVELYVQDANKTHHSQGIYSIQNDDWVSVPKRRRPDVDDISVRSKFEDLGHRIESAIASGDLVKITDMAEKLRDYRQAGLDAHGEFGAENLAFKILRTQGLIEKLYAARNRAKDELLSLDERKRKKKKRSVKYGYGAYWYPGTAYAGQDHPAGTEGGDGGGGGGDGGESLREGVPDTQQILKDFVEFAVEDLGIQQMPAIKLRRDPQWPVVNRTFGRYNDDAETLEVAWGQRHIMDVLRTVAHELTHKHQHERETVPDDAGETGSDYENEANAQAGILMRDYAALHPEYFASSPLDEVAPIGFVVPGQVQDPVRAWKRQVRELILQYREDPTRLGELAKEKGAGSAEAVAYAYMRNPTARIPLPPGAEVNEGASGYIPTRKQARDPRFSMALTVDIKPGQIGKEANKLKLKTDSQGRPQTAQANGLFETLMAEYSQIKQGKQAPVAEVSDDRLQTYLNRAGQQVDRRQERMAQARERLNKGYEIYHAEDPTFIVHRFEANTPAEARRYYETFIDRYESDRDFDLQLRRSTGLMESEEDLDEVKMSPGALEKFATSDAAKGIRAGFEAELIFRDTQGSSDDIDPEPNYDADERAYSIQQVVEFFENDEYGYGLTDRERNRLEERLDEAYMQWRDDQITSDFRNDAEDLIRDVLLEETPMSERINVYLTDSMQRSDDEADRIIAAGVDAPKFNTSKDQAAYAAENPDYAAYLEAADAAETELDESVEYSVKEQDGYWDEALDDYRDSYSGDDDSFFSDIGLRWMSDIANEYGLDWPVWDMDNQRNEGSRSWEDIGAELQAVVDMPVVVSDNYHSTTRRPGQWILEPDGSLGPDDQSEEAGLEIVSPPLPLLTAIEKLKQVTDWANDPQGGNAYTNSTTGLHMGVSLPKFTSEAADSDAGIDYVKLILFMGDKYVLDQFGRTANNYAASALDKLKLNIQKKKSDPAGVVELLRYGLTELAYRELQKGVGTSKYTSAHIQDGYIEFRSPGGDWLAKSDEEIGILENTMLRFARAMAIAGDPSAERQEYAKKLYKLVTQENPQYADALKLFSEYSAGTINREQLKKQWADAVLQKEIPTTGQEEYEVYDMANKNSPFGIIDTFYATDYDSAYNQYIKKYSQDPRQLDVRLKQPWFDVMDSYGDIILTVRASDFDRAKEKVQAEYGDRLSDDYEIYRRPDDTPEPEKKLSPRAQVAKRITTKPKTATQYNYDIVDQRTVELRVVDQFRAETPAEAERVYSAWLKSKDLPDDTANYGYRKNAQAADDQRDSVDIQRTLGIRDVDTDVAQNFAPDYSAYERNSDRIDAIRAQAQQPRQNYELVSDEDPDRIIHRMNNATADEVRAYIAQQEAGGMPTGFLRTRIVAESIDPVSGAGAVPPRQDPKSISKKSVTPAEKVSKNLVKGQPYRSAIGQAISQKDLENLTQQIQVARKLGDSVMEMEDTPPEVLRALDQAAQKNGYRNWADVKANPRSSSAVMTVAKLANTIMKTTPPHHAEKLFYKNKTDENFVADVDEGWKQALAGAALAGGIAMAPGTARATDVAQSPNVNKPATTQSAGINFQETLKDLASFGVMFIPGIGPVIKAVNLIRSGAEIASAVSDYKKASDQFDAALARQQAQRSVDLTTATEEEKEEFLRNNKLVELDDIPSQPLPAWTQQVGENFADGKVKGKSRPGRVKRAGASCDGSVTDLRRRAKNSSGEKAKMYHWCANMKSGKKNESEMDEGWKQNVAAGVLGAGMALGGGTAQADTDVLDKKFTPAEIQQIQTKADLTQRYYNELVRRAKEDGRTMDRRTLNMLKAQAEDAVARSVQQQPQAPQAKSTLPGTQPSEIRRSSNYKNFESVKK